MPTGLSETVALQINAPATYAYNPTTITIQSFIGNYSGKTALSVARDWVRQHQYADPNSIAKCSVANVDAAFARYSTNGLVGYRVFLIRIDQQTAGLARLWSLTVEGSGGLGADTIADAKRVLGSWQWDK